MTALDSLLETYRTQTATQRDRGTAFEKLTAAWFVTDPVQSKRFAEGRTVVRLGASARHVSANGCRH